MIKWLTYIGLAVLPFLIVIGGGGRYPQEVFSLMIASAIVFYSLSKGLLKPFKNTQVLVLLFLLIIAVNFVPPTGMALGYAHDNTFIIDSRIDVDNLWNYKPILYAFIYLIFVIAVASIEIESFVPYFTIIAWTGTLTASIAILQKLGFNQFWHVKDIGEIGLIESKEMIAFIGQPTLVAAFVSLCYMSTLYIKKYWMSAVIILCVLLTGSAFGKLAIISATLLWLAILTKDPKKSILIGLSIAAVVAFVMYFVLKITPHGRDEVWVQIIKDLTTPLYGKGNQYGFTGYGAGAFHYVFPIMHNARWGQAHNEFLEFLFNNGAFGLILLISAICAFVKDCWKVFYDRDIQFLVCSFLVVCVLCNGTFVWQLAWGMFYTCIFIGLAYNRIRSLK